MKTNLLSQIVTYLKNPVYIDKIEKQPFLQSLYQIIRINLLALLVSIISGFFIAFISTKTNALNEHAVGDFIQNESLIVTFVFACIVAPLLEESAFRLWLINKPIQVSVGIVFFLFYYISSFVPGSILENIFSPFASDSPAITIISFIIGFGFLFGCIFSIIKSKVVQKKLQFLYKEYFFWIFYVSAFLFGFLHITNYKFNWIIVLLTPILILPQLSGGVLLSYIRVKYGFWKCVLGHFIYNMSLLLPSLALKTTSENIQNSLDSNFSFSSLAGNDKIILLSVILYFMFIISLVIISNIHLIYTYTFPSKKKNI